MVRMMLDGLLAQEVACRHNVRVLGDRIEAHNRRDLIGTFEGRQLLSDRRLTKQLAGCASNLLRALEDASHHVIAGYRA